MIQQKILIIRFSSIGDIVLTSPIIRAVHNKNRKVHFLCKEKFASLVQYNPYIDQVFCYPDNHNKSKLNSLLHELKSQKYNWIIDLQSNLRSHAICWLVPCFYISRLQKNRWQRWLYSKFKLGMYPSHPRKHVVDRMIWAIKHPTTKSKWFLNKKPQVDMRIFDDQRGLEFFLPPKLSSKDKKQTDQLLQSKYLSLVIGGTYTTKRLPIEQLQILINSLTPTLSIVLLGGHAEKKIASTLIKNSHHRIVNLCDRLTLHGAAKVISRSQLVISHDTGLMHIATAFQKPLIAIWGNTSPIFGMSPYYGKSISKSKMATPRYFSIEIPTTQLRCHPCTHLGYSQCPRHHFRCMRELDMQMIAKKVHLLLANQNSCSSKAK